MSYLPLNKRAGFRSKHMVSYLLSRMAENLSLPAFPFFDVETDKVNAGPRWGK